MSINGPNPGFGAFQSTSNMKSLKNQVFNTNSEINIADHYEHDEVGRQFHELE